MPKPRSALLLHLLLLCSCCIANAGATDDAPSTFQGEWQLLHASIGVSAMHMQLLPGDFVLMFYRTDTGPSNISLPALSPCAAATADSVTAAADCTAHSVLLDLRSNVLHPYPLATNPWCSSGALLPNSTLLQTGGFSNGDRVARLFSPATGWVELPSYLAARRWLAWRWYATDIVQPCSLLCSDDCVVDLDPTFAPVRQLPVLEPSHSNSQQTEVEDEQETLRYGDERPGRTHGLSFSREPTGYVSGRSYSDMRVPDFS